MLDEIGADGVFLDTLKEGDPALLGRLGRVVPPPVLEGESRVPLVRIADHQASWAQWFADSDVPGVLRARWFEQRHQMHHTRRWNRSHRAELQSAWVNGAGVLIWDVVFGVWVGWNDRDLRDLRAARRVHRTFGDHLLHGAWEPLTDLHRAATASGVHGSRWMFDDTELFTLVHRGTSPYEGPILSTPAADRSLVVDLMSGRLLGPQAQLTVRPGDLVGLLVVDAGRPAQGLDELLAAVADDPPADCERFPARAITRLTPLVATGPALEGAVVLTPGERDLVHRYRARETGLYEDAPYVGDWKPLPPRLHDLRQGSRPVQIGRVAVDAHEVTNGDFAAFLAESGYRPRDPNRFVAQWVDGVPVPGTEHRAVTYVDLDDARAYAVWRGARLPTEDEWQLAAHDPAFLRSEPLVWAWTESEHRDGRTRWAILKGGSWFKADGSDWYVDGGPQDPEWSVRLLLMGAGMARSECIGFRCAVDLPAVEVTP